MNMIVKMIYKGDGLPISFFISILDCTL